MTFAQYPFPTVCHLFIRRIRVRVLALIPEARSQIEDRHQHVGGLQIAVHDTLLVRVLHALVDLRERLQPFLRRQPLAVAVGGDWLAIHVLHHELRPSFRRAAVVEHRCDRGVVHEREGLPLGLEPRYDLSGVHPGLEMTFRATGRRTGVACSASQTSPMPPSPILWSRRYEPKLLAELVLAVSVRVESRSGDGSGSGALIRFPPER